AGQAAPGGKADAASRRSVLEADEFADAARSLLRLHLVVDRRQREYPPVREAQDRQISLRARGPVRLRLDREFVDLAEGHRLHLAQEEERHPLQPRHTLLAIEGERRLIED